MIFKNYAKYYDILNEDKNYNQEVDYIETLIEKYSDIKVKTILDVGCGTGNHALYFSKKGYYINGIDLSEEMIKIAKKKEKLNLKFDICSTTDFCLKNKFDAILSLFHVISYQTTNNDMNKLLENVSNHLNNGGLFIFDCWYGPTVLTERPCVRVKRLENEDIMVTRIAEPIIYPNENMVDVNYEIIVEDKRSSDIEHINETHRMRYFFKAEIELLLNINNMKLLHCEEFITGKHPGFNTWGVCFVAKKCEMWS